MEKPELDIDYIDDKRLGYAIKQGCRTN